MYLAVKAKIEASNLDQRRIVYCDECTFTHNAVQNTAYSLARQKTTIPNQEGPFRKFNLVAAMSFEFGLEAVYITE